MGTVHKIEGHDMKIEPTESGRRFRLLCSCGFGFARWIGETPATCATEREAVRKGIWHLQKIDEQMRKAERDGVSTTSSQRSA